MKTFSFYWHDYKDNYSRTVIASGLDSQDALNHLIIYPTSPPDETLELRNLKGDGRVHFDSWNDV